MKKLILMLATGLILVACGGKQKKKETTPQEAQTTISTEEAEEVIELEKAADELIEKTEELNQQLDSLIKEI